MWQQVGWCVTQGYDMVEQWWRARLAKLSYLSNIDTWWQIHMVGLWDVYHARGGWNMLPVPEEAQ